MEEKIKELKNRFRTAKTDSELACIDKEMFALSENSKEFSEKMLASIKETNNEIEGILLKDKIKEILPAISISYLAKEYFHKTPQWFYQRLNGNIVNGKKASFSEEELEIVAKALKDISDKIQHSVALVV